MMEYDPKHHGLPGTANGMAKLTESQISAIQTSKLSNPAAAKRWGVSVSTIKRHRRAGGSRSSVEEVQMVAMADGRELTLDEFLHEEHDQGIAPDCPLCTPVAVQPRGSLRTSQPPVVATAPSLEFRVADLEALVAELRADIDDLL